MTKNRIYLHLFIKLSKAANYEHVCIQMWLLSAVHVFLTDDCRELRKRVRELEYPVKVDSRQWSLT